MDDEQKSLLLNSGLAGKRAIVTGAAGEIGQAITRHLVAADVRVLMVDRDQSGLEALEVELGSNVASLVADVANENEMSATVDKAVADFGGLDIAVLNAGIEGAVESIADYDVDLFDRVMAVNVRGVWLGMKYAIAAMQTNPGGSIIAMASASGIVGSAKCSAYVASKHAVIGLVRALAAEVGREGIRINAVAPAPIEGRMIQSLESGYIPDDPARVRRAMEKMLPLGRYGKASEIAALVAFLASDAASYSTGGVFAADGGMTAAR